MLLTTGQAAGELGCAITTFRRLIRAGLLPGLSRRGVRVMVPLGTVQALQARDSAPLHELEAREIAVMRADVAQPSASGQRPTGFSTSMSTEALRESLQGWWRCDAASVAAGGVLPVTLSGYVVAVLTGLDRWERDEKGRHGFPDAALAGYVTDLAQPAVRLTAADRSSRDLATLLLGTRLPSHSGGTIAYVNTRTPS